MVETRISFKYLLKRLVVSVFIIWALLTLLFLLLKAMPGDVSQLLLNPNLDAEAIAAIRERYGLNDPLWKQYLKWIWNYMTLNFGYSVQRPEPVVDLVLMRLPRTLALFGTAALLQYTVGVFAGIYFGWQRGSLLDRGGFMSGLTLYSVPFFWIAWMLLLVFSFRSDEIKGWIGEQSTNLLGTNLAWLWPSLPTGQMTEKYVSVFSAVPPPFNTEPFVLLDVLVHLLLPAGALVVVGWGGTMLVMRTSMQEVVHAPYIETARAKGLSPATVKYKHAARNALIPVVTQGIIAIAFIIDGSVIVEQVFSWPGIGKLLIEAILQRDFPVALAAFFWLGVLIVTLRFLTDVVYTYLDPRIKFGESE